MGRGVVGSGVGSGEGRGVGSGVVGSDVGTDVGLHVYAEGSDSQQGVPKSLSVVTLQPEVTPLERACTGVGTSSQSLFEWKRKTAVILSSWPSSVGSGPVKLLESKAWDREERV